MRELNSSDLEMVSGGEDPLILETVTVTAPRANTSSFTAADAALFGLSVDEMAFGLSGGIVKLYDAPDSLGELHADGSDALIWLGNAGMAAGAVGLMFFLHQILPTLFQPRWQEWVEHFG